ncbi:TPA: hypothetical protein ACVO35_001287 [Vibrio alginolyticus]
MILQSEDKVALVTGGNQGLGFTIVKHLANRLNDEDTIYLCFRNIKRGYHSLNELGQKALQKLSLQRMLRWRFRKS